MKLLGKSRMHAFDYMRTKNYRFMAFFDSKMVVYIVRFRMEQ